ncbi:hypothetical protein [Alterisphingorhabdus coralli]|uniref:Uncharacterized protein n=1 Tax=Alterisphingorhabdus coralli TaxID=3071408 RepID=A0AA97I1N2_9SPHN|nr:hypothetical protein [Parasphingorhabdus sp. SCSIO 66989]WOE74930.1 hypothetical protein RB602_13985 [Parasphingorhabdus sp. SCSIO 66989]
MTILMPYLAGANHALAADTATIQEGDVYILSHAYETSSKSSDGSTGSSGGQTALIQRIVSIRSDGWVVEYDLPPETSEDARMWQWQFPFSVFRPHSGEWQLLGSEELIQRRDAWLASAEIPGEACGTYFFTWNAFKIECDLQSAIAIAKDYDTGLCEFGEGYSLDLPLIVGKLILESVNSGGDGPDLSGQADIAADAVRQSRAESDVISAQILGEELSLSEAMGRRSQETIAGTMTANIWIDENACLLKQVTASEVIITDVNSVTETRTATYTLTREPISVPENQATPSSASSP